MVAACFALAFSTSSTALFSQSASSFTSKPPDAPANWKPLIGNYTGARDALRDAENSMFLEGKDPKSALKDAGSNATSAIDDYNSKIGV